MGTTIHFPQSAYESGLDLAEKRPVPGADGQAGPEPAAPAIPGMPGAAERAIPPEPEREAGTGARPRPLSGWKPAVSAALWGLAAAGVLLGCREAAGMGEWLREAVLWAVSIGVAGWCGLSPAGQPGIVLVLLLRAMGTGSAAAGAWQGRPPGSGGGAYPLRLVADPPHQRGVRRDDGFFPGGPAAAGREGGWGGEVSAADGSAAGGGRGCLGGLGLGDGEDIGVKSEG